LDEKWERLSDSLRDQNKCDDNTGRRLFDNGFHKDRTRIGNPVLGGLCKPVPLLPLDLARAYKILDVAEESALSFGADVASLKKQLVPSSIWYSLLLKEIIIAAWVKKTN